MALFDYGEKDSVRSVTAVKEWRTIRLGVPTVKATLATVTVVLVDRISWKKDCSNAKIRTLLIESS